MSAMEGQDGTFPVFLLKTKTVPNDAYEDHFQTLNINGKRSRPVFVPVLKHYLVLEQLRTIEIWLEGGVIGLGGRFGGIIFTSQRAVEAFAKCVTGIIERNPDYQLPEGIYYYVVGPATQRTLSSVPTLTKSSIYGADTGNGESLARFIQAHFGPFLPGEALTTRSLLFLVGEQRRDIVPRILTTGMPDEPGTMPKKAIDVQELVVYETRVMDTFSANFQTELGAASATAMAWVVVFSPTGCEAMLRCLGWLDENGRHKPDTGRRRRFIATIGPTTRDFLRSTFGCEPDVCAEKPSAEGVSKGIRQFMESRQPE